MKCCIQIDLLKWFHHIKMQRYLHQNRVADLHFYKGRLSSYSVSAFLATESCQVLKLTGSGAEEAVDED